VVAGVRLREITSEEGNRLSRIVRRSAGSVVNVASRTDRAVLGPGHVVACDQRGRFHRSGHGQGCHS
jgi:hypothetical protein